MTFRWSRWAGSRAPLVETHSPVIELVLQQIVRLNNTPEHQNASRFWVSFGLESIVKVSGNRTELTGQEESGRLGGADLSYSGKVVPSQAWQASKVVRRPETAAALEWSFFFFLD